MDSNTILLIIVVFYLVYSFIKTRKKEKIPVAAPDKINRQPDITDYEKHVIAAVIAALMQDKKHIVKSIFAVGRVDEKISAWKVSGRQESMNKRLFFRKE